MKSVTAWMLAVILAFTSFAIAFAAPSTDPSEDFVYIGDIGTEDSSVGYDSLQIDKAMGSDRLSLVQADGTTKEYAKGIFAHAPSELVYDIAGLNATKFSTIYGINTTANDVGSCEFIIKADDVTLHTSKVMHKADGGRYVEVLIPEDAKTLTLITTWGDNSSNNNDHSVWIEPKLYVPDTGVTRNLSMTVEDTVLRVGQSTSINVKGIALNGVTSVIPADSLTFVSDNPEVIHVNAEGVLTANAAGSANVTVSLNVNGIIKSSSVKVMVAREDSIWSVTSPASRIEATLLLDTDGSLTYTAKQDGKTVVNNSNLGIVTSLGDFSSGLTVKEVSQNVIDETYTMKSGKSSVNHNHANEAILTFTKADAEFVVYFRAYDDGYAFRYTVQKSDDSTGALSISEETSSFSLPGGSNVFGMESHRGDNVFNHEENFTEKKIEDMKDAQSMPMLYQAPNGLWTLITEADLYGDAYCGSFLAPTSGNNLKLTYAPFQQGNVSTTYPFTSPWRLAISGTMADVVESNLVENVSPDSILEDDDWVIPGVTAWTWMTAGLSGQSSFENIKKYIDFASEMGWKYYIMDEGWQPRDTTGSGKKYNGYYEWFDELVEYAREKGIGLFAWILADDLNTPEKREVLQEYAEKGIVGIKVDFFDSESQQRIALYKDIYEECTNNKLLVNVHGANKPTGEVRTYPNIFNREAVRGEEYSSFNTYQTTIWPFTRGVVGPMDVTPKVYPGGSSNTTTGQQVAMNVMFESGQPCMASSVEDYKSSPALSFLKGLPAAWDEIHYIDGYPGQFATLARRSGDVWYAASITNQAQDAVFPLDFLGEGDFYAIIYRDGEGKRDMIVESQKVNSDDILTIPMSNGGGCSIKLIPAKPGSSIDSVTIDAEAKMEAGTTLQLTPVITPEAPIISDILWSSSNPAVATVSSGKVDALKPGIAVITVSSAIDPEVKASCVVSVTRQTYVPYDGWEIVMPSANASDRTQIDPDNPHKITLKTLFGDCDISENGQNVWLREAPEGDFTLTVKVSGELYTNYQGVALTAYHNHSNVVSMIRRFHSNLGASLGGGNIFELFHWNSSDTYIEHPVADPKKDAPAYLKLEKSGNVFTGSYSYDNENWVTISKSITSSLVGDSDNLKIGVYAFRGQQSNDSYSLPVTIENFTCNGEAIPFIQENQDRSICAVINPADITVDFGTAFTNLSLPETVDVYLADGSTQSVAVAWNEEDYIPSTGSCVITGSLLSEELPNPDKLTACITVTVNDPKPLDFEISGPVYKGEDFQVKLTTVERINKLTLKNETGRWVGSSILSVVQTEDGRYETTIQLWVGTIGKNRVLTVYDGETALGLFSFDVDPVPTQIFSVEAPESAVAGEPFQVTVTTTEDLTKGVFFNDSNRGIGRTRISRYFVDGKCITTYELMIATAGQSRKFIFKADFDRMNDYEYTKEFVMDILPK